MGKINKIASNLFSKFLSLLFIFEIITIYREFKIGKSGNPKLGNLNFKNNFDDNTCSAPNLFTDTNSLTIYGKNLHFYTEFICMSCDNGNYYFNTHGFGPNGTENGDQYGGTRNNNLYWVTIKLTDEQAKMVLNTIIDFEHDPYRYNLFLFNCIDYVQRIYASAKPDHYFTDEFKHEFFSGSAGAVAFTKQHSLFSTSTIFSALRILMQPSVQQDGILDYSGKAVFCNFKNKRNIFHEEPLCVKTPAGALVPLGYEFVDLAQRKPKLG